MPTPSHPQPCPARVRAVDQGERARGDGEGAGNVVAAWPGLGSTGGIVRTAASAAATAMGTLMNRHHRQLVYSVSTPPRINPTAPPPPATAP